MKRYVVLGLLALAASLVVPMTGGTGLAQEASGDPAVAPELGRVQPGDRLQVLVFGQPELSRTVPVQRDGSITYLPIGRLVVAGQTVEKVAERIVKGLEESYRMVEPRVSVAIDSSEARAAAVYILGAVGAPGSHPLPKSRPLMVTQLVALAGGFGEFADLRRISIQHFAEGRRAHQIIDLSNLERTGISDNDVELRDGDTVYVPRLRVPGTEVGVAPKEVSVFGQVNTPGAVTISPDEPLTVLRAIARARGITRLADRGDVVLLREAGSKRDRTVLDIDKILDGDAADPVLQPGDILYVGERGW